MPCLLGRVKCREAAGTRPSPPPSLRRRVMPLGRAPRQRPPTSHTHTHTCPPPTHPPTHPRSDRPVPIPAPGVQLTSLSHVEDLADMLARVPGNFGAMREHFNLVSDRCITLDGEPHRPSLQASLSLSLPALPVPCCTALPHPGR